MPSNPHILDFLQRSAAYGVVAVLDRSRVPADMDLPGFRLHRLEGALKDHYAVSVSGNWRVTFRFEEGHAVDVDYVDYH